MPLMKKNPQRMRLAVMPNPDSYRRKTPNVPPKRGKMMSAVIRNPTM